MSVSPLVGNSVDLEQIQSGIDDQGYAVVPSVIPTERADEIRLIVEDLLAAEKTEQHSESKAQRVGQIAIKHSVFTDLMCHDLAVAVWHNWLGRDMICSTWTSNTFYPGHNTFGWHADYPYWALEQPWPSGNFTGQTIWMLDDFTYENGATGVVPGSHHLLSPPTYADEWRDDAVVLEGVRGSVAFLHGALWHTGRPNTTDQSRSCLLGMYIRPHCLPMEDMRGQLSRLEDPSELVTQIMGGNQRQPQDVTG